jgi:hypothetical protein
MILRYESVFLLSQPHWKDLPGTGITTSSIKIQNFCYAEHHYAGCRIAVHGRPFQLGCDSEKHSSFETFEHLRKLLRRDQY